MVWNWKTGERVHRFRGHTQRVFRVDFDITRIISSSQDEFMIVWEFDDKSIPLEVRTVSEV